MMDKVIRYSILRYSPRVKVGESINLGILVVDEEDNMARFVYSKKKNRVEVFDDEVKYSSVLHMLKSIESEVSAAMLERKRFDLDDFIMYYINSFYFDEPKKLVYPDYDEAVENLRSIYLWFDYDKKERKTKADSVRFFRKLMESNGVKSYYRKLDIGSDYNDEVYYDLQTDKYNVVLFDINEKNKASQLNVAKMWSWNAVHHKSDKKMLFVMKTNEMSEGDYSVLQRILTDSGAEVIDYEDALKRVLAN